MNEPATAQGGHGEGAWLLPVLAVRDGAAAVAFYERALGAAVVVLERAPDGAVAAQMRVGDACFMVSDESPEHQNFSPERLGGSTVRLGLVVADPDAVFARALAAGGREVYPVADQPWRWRQGRLEDPFGHHWEIGRPLAGTPTA
jgi:PhnB protein